ncbi:MAG: hypothetical protein AAGA46_15050, partial [Cyanobacteria bacterium P01_F01_bin.13]
CCDAAGLSLSIVTPLPSTCLVRRGCALTVSGVAGGLSRWGGGPPPCGLFVGLPPNPHTRLSFPLPWPPTKLLNPTPERTRNPT